MKTFQEAETLFQAALDFRSSLMSAQGFNKSYRVIDNGGQFPVLVHPDGTLQNIPCDWNKYAQAFDFYPSDGGVAVSSIPSGYDGPAPISLLSHLGF